MGTHTDESEPLSGSDIVKRREATHARHRIAKID